MIMLAFFINLGGCAASRVLCRFQEMLGLMRESMPQTNIVVQGLYPRGADFDGNKYVWPNNYTYALNLLNAHYEVMRSCDLLTQRTVACNILLKHGMCRRK